MTITCVHTCMHARAHTHTTISRWDFINHAENFIITAYLQGGSAFYADHAHRLSGSVSPMDRLPGDESS